MSVIKFLLKFKLLTITFIGICSFSVSSISYAHSYSSKAAVEYQPRIQLIGSARVQDKLLPKALYTQTMGHTYKRTFAFQNKPIKQVFYDASQPTHKLYATLMPHSYKTKRASSYWP